MNARGWLGLTIFFVAGCAQTRLHYAGPVDPAYRGDAADAQLLVTIYDTPSGGKAVAGPFRPTAGTIEDGHAAFEYGPVATSLFSSSQQGRPLWLEISVDEETLPRIRLTPDLPAKISRPFYVGLGDDWLSGKFWLMARPWLLDGKISASIRADHDRNAGIIELFSDPDVPTVSLTASDATGTGPNLALSSSDGECSVLLSGGSSQSGGSLELRNAGSPKPAAILSARSEAKTGGELLLTNAANKSHIKASFDNAGAVLTLQDDGGDDTIRLIGGESAIRIDSSDASNPQAILSASSEDHADARLMLHPGTDNSRSSFAASFAERAAYLALSDDTGRETIRLTAAASDSSVPSTILLRGSDGTVRCNVVDVLGGADIAEPFTVSPGTAIPPGSVVSMDAMHPGRVVISGHPYDPKVVGVVAGANGLQSGIVLRPREESISSNQVAVAMLGRVWCLCDATTHAIAPGDRLTTSTTAGHARKVTDNSRAQGAVIGKAMTSLDSGTGLVLVLIQPQ